jgi:hypothetical protein
MCSIEGGDSFSKTVVREQLAEKVLCIENAAFPGETPRQEKSFIIVETEEVTSKGRWFPE